ncbi:ribokinase [Rudaeicoccus suwonensis]|uniref:Ribokinase n=1 Tax=Rudaeicoccus suwonensis TaxID=657409 RepID=A0A561E125_9MICO|nr:ribokinase [Rudaeicoccus suwonensis]TWE09297.1 ribokinase [Rudaeicoccus suwonensis]
MQVREGVLVVGSINLDTTITVDSFPRPGETLLGTGLITSVGGKGANQAVAAARMGGWVGMTGAVGADASGQQALEKLRADGVDVTGVRELPEAPTGTAWITVADGDNTIIVIAGANSQWPAVPELPDASIMLCQLEIPLSVVEIVAERFQGRLVLNAAPSQPLPDSLLQRCEVLIVNEHELADLVGTPDVTSSNRAALVRAAHQLRARGAEAVVATLGGDGAMLVDADEVTWIEPPPVAEVVDTTGAGDAFCGAFAARLAAGSTMADAARWGVAAGSFAVGGHTAQGSYGSLEQVRAMYDLTRSVHKDR